VIQPRLIEIKMKIPFRREYNAGEKTRISSGLRNAIWSSMERISLL